jgi:hypothetical protein
VINRRIFLEAAAAATLPAVVNARAPRNSVQTERPSTPALHTFLNDARFASSRAAGERLRAAHVTVHTLTEGDVTRFWRENIGPVWREHPVTVAGLTARPALFCLEQMALGCGLRVVFHAEHVVHAAGRTEHWVLRAAAPTAITARDLALAGVLWPVRIAQSIADFPASAAGERFGRSDAALDPALPPGAQLLTSWIIAAA